MSLTPALILLLIGNWYRIWEESENSSRRWYHSIRGIEKYNQRNTVSSEEVEKYGSYL